MNTQKPHLYCTPILDTALHNRARDHWVVNGVYLGTRSAALDRLTSLCIGTAEERLRGGGRASGGRASRHSETAAGTRHIVEGTRRVEVIHLEDRKMSQKKLKIS